MWDGLVWDGHSCPSLLTLTLQVWSGHSCPLPLTFRLPLILGGAAVHRCDSRPTFSRAFSQRERHESIHSRGRAALPAPRQTPHDTTGLQPQHPPCRRHPILATHHEREGHGFEPCREALQNDSGFSRWETPSSHWTSVQNGTAPFSAAAF